MNESAEPTRFSGLDRRGNPRRPTMAVVTLRFPEGTIMGAGRDLSRTGAYFITSDEIQVDVQLECDGKEVRTPAKLVRIDNLSPGTHGIAVHFERELEEDL